jgi:chemotaxis protein MotB
MALKIRPRRRDMIDADDPHVSRIGLPAPPWLVNYADLMTELTIFFMVLWAISAALSKDLQKARDEIEKTMAEEGIRGEVVLQKDGLRLSLEEGGQTSLFPSGNADLTPEMVSILERMRPTLQRLQKNHDVVVEGHTDDVPVRGGKYGSNWDLSTARATSVVRHLIEKQGYEPKRLAAIGYGEHRPAVPNDSEENRAKNRRVVLIVKPPDKAPSDKAPPAEERKGSD